MMQHSCLYYIAELLMFVISHSLLMCEVLKTFHSFNFFQHLFASAFDKE